MPWDNCLLEKHTLFGLGFTPQLNAKAWVDLGIEGGGKVGGVPHSAAECYLRALEIDRDYAPAWSKLMPNTDFDWGERQCLAFMGHELVFVDSRFG